MSLDGSVYMVHLLEVDLKQVTFGRDRKITWPRLNNDAAAPIVDGALLLHDSTRLDKLAGTTMLLGTCGLLL